MKTHIMSREFLNRLREQLRTGDYGIVRANVESTCNDVVKVNVEIILTEEILEALCTSN